MTSIDEIADGIYRIFTPIDIPGTGGFSFNQYLIADDEPCSFTPVCVGSSRRPATPSRE